MADEKIRPGVGVVDKRSNTARQGSEIVPVAPSGANESAQGDKTKSTDAGYVPNYDKAPENTNESLADVAARLKAKKAADAAVKAKTTSTPKTDDKKTPTYHKGTDFVPKTGKAILKKGEAVLKNDDAEKFRQVKMMGLAAASMGGEDKKTEEKPKKVKEMRIRKAHKGHIIEHHHTHPDAHPMEEFTAPDMAALHSHVDEHMPQDDEGSEEVQEQE